MYQQSAGTSPKQQMSLGQYLGSAGNINAAVAAGVVGSGSGVGVGGGGSSSAVGGGGSSPSSASSQSGRLARSNNEFGGGARKSTSTGEND